MHLSPLSDCSDLSQRAQSCRNVPQRVVACPSVFIVVVVVVLVGQKTMKFLIKMQQDVNK